MVCHFQCIAFGRKVWLKMPYPPPLGLEVMNIFHRIDRVDQFVDVDDVVTFGIEAVKSVVKRGAAFSL